jgi:glutamyl-tRNA synthetase
VRTLQERSRTLVEMAEGATFYFLKEVEYDPEAAGKFLGADQAPLFRTLIEKLGGNEDFSEAGIAAVFQEVMAENGLKLGKIGPPVRVALTGMTSSPGIYEVISVLGREETVRRLKRALDHIR